jgi:hypothetical protein
MRQTARGGEPIGNARTKQIDGLGTAPNARAGRDAGCLRQSDAAPHGDEVNANGMRRHPTVTPPL